MRQVSGFTGKIFPFFLAVLRRLGCMKDKLEVGALAMLLRLQSLEGKFRTVETRRVATTQEALAAVEAHVKPHGFANVHVVEDEDPIDGWRFTAKTPGGRNGRNVAYLDYEMGDDIEMRNLWADQNEDG